MYRITECLSVGPFASAERVPQLLAAGVTHVLNVSDGPSVVSAADGFTGVEWAPLKDSRRLTSGRLRELLGALHRMASVPNAHVYVHCVYGQLRSPTVLWMYLIGLGVPPKDARDWIEERSPDAVAGHPDMVDHEHVLLAQKHGLKHFFPHPRPNLITPWPLAEEGKE